GRPEATVARADHRSRPRGSPRGRLVRPAPSGILSGKEVTMRARARSSASVGVVRLLALAPLGVLVLAPGAFATEVRFPLSVEHPVLQSALRKHLREQSGGAMELWRTADGCGSL